MGLAKSDPSGRQIRRVHPALLAGASLLALGAGLWVARIPIAEALIGHFLSSDGLVGKVDLARLELSQIALSADFRDADGKGVVAPAVTIDLDWPAPFVVRVEEVRILRPQMRGEWDGRQLRLGPLDALINAPQDEERSPLALPAINIIDAEVDLRLDGGDLRALVQASAEGDKVDAMAAFAPTSLIFDDFGAILSGARANFTMDGAAFKIDGDAIAASARGQGVEAQNVGVVFSLNDRGGLMAELRASQASFEAINARGPSAQVELALGEQIFAGEFDQATGTIRAQAAEIAGAAADWRLQDLAADARIALKGDRVQASGGANAARAEAMGVLARAINVAFATRDQAAGGRGPALDVLADMSGAVDLQAVTVRDLIAALRGLPEPLAGFSRDLAEDLDALGGEAQIRAKAELIADTFETPPRLLLQSPLRATGRRAGALAAQSALGWLVEVDLGDQSWRSAPGLAARLSGLGPETIALTLESAYGAGARLGAVRGSLEGVAWQALDGAALAMAPVPFTVESGPGGDLAAEFAVKASLIDAKISGALVDNAAFEGAFRAVIPANGANALSIGARGAQLAAAGVLADGTRIGLSEPLALSKEALLTLPRDGVSPIMLEATAPTLAVAVRLAGADRPEGALSFNALRLSAQLDVDGGLRAVIAAAETLANIDVGTAQAPFPVDWASKNLVLTARLPSASAPIFADLSLAGARFASPASPAALRGGAIEATLAIDADGLRVQTLKRALGEVYAPGEAPLFGAMRVSAEGATQGGVFAGQANAALSARPLSTLVRADIQHEWASATGQASLRTGALTVEPGGLQLAQILPSIASLAQNSAGGADADGEVRWSKAGLAPITATVALRDLSFEPEGLPRIEGLTTQIRFDDFLNLTSLPDQIVRVLRIEGPLPLENGEIRFQMKKDGIVDISSARWPFAGGFLTLRPAQWRLDGEPNDIVIEAAAIDLAPLAQMLKLNDVDLTGIINGAVPIRIAGEDLAVEKGLLSAGGAGRVRYAGAVGAQAASAAGAAKLAFDGLSDFAYDLLSAELNGKLNGPMRLDLVLEGRNPALLYGHPIRYEIGVEADFAQLLAQTSASLNLWSVALSSSEAQNSIPPAADGGQDEPEND